MSLTKIRKSNIESNVRLPHANAAFDTANSSGAYANAAFNAANNATDTWVRNAANSSSSYANGAFGAANTANTLAQAAFNAANNAVDTWVRDAANSGSSYANSAYAQANTPSDVANSASSYANSGYNQANTANQQSLTSGAYANAAYAHSNTKLSSSGGIIDGDLSVTGNLIISGNTTTVDVETLRVSDPIILLANNNTTDLVDIGFTAHYGATEKHTGLLRHAATQEYYLFDNYDGHILHQNNSVSISNADFRIVTLNANLKSNTVVVRGVEVLDRVNSSYSTVNTVSLYANAAYNQANTPSHVANSASSYANGSYVAANTADQRAVTSGAYANAAYNQANTGNILAQAAFNAANNATDTWVRNAANSASSYANSAYIHANAAFAVANTGGGGGSGTDEFARTTANAAFDTANSVSALQNNSFYVNAYHDNFVADGTSNTFTLSTSPIDKNYTIVSFDGVLQHKSVYSVDSANLSFDSPPTVNTEIDVVSFGRTPGNFSVNITHDNFTSDGSNTTFTLSIAPENENYTLVTINGVVQHKDAYSLSGSTITLSESPVVNSSIDIITFTGIAALYSNVSSNIVPSVTETYDLGSSDKRWRDLYLSGNTINLGNTTISSSGNTLILPTETKIGSGDTSLPTSGAFMFRNKLINGNFDIWQRSTSQTGSGYGSADRWNCNNNGSTKTASLQSFTLGQTNVPGNPKYFMRHVVSSVAGVGNYVIMFQPIEGVNTFSGKTITLSFWAKADANKNIAVELSQYFGSGGSPSAEVSGIGSQLVSLTTSWTKYSLTVNIPSTSGKTIGTNNDDYLRPIFWFNAGSNFNVRAANLGQQSGTFDISQVQLEEGTVSTSFEERHISIELQMCYRYYYLMTSAGTNAFIAFAHGTGVGSSLSDFVVPTPIPMRTNVGVSISARSTFWVDSGNPGSSFSIIDPSKFGIVLRLNAGTTGYSYKLRANGVTNAFIAFDAEL